MSAPARLAMDPAQRRRVRRNALLLGLLALAVYGAFVVHAVVRGLK